MKAAMDKVLRKNSGYRKVALEHGIIEHRKGKTAVITSTPYEKELEALRLSENGSAINKKTSKNVLAKKVNRQGNNIKLQKTTSTLGQEAFVFIVKIKTTRT